MPKMKTNRSAAKRFKRTGGSRVKRGTANRRHLLTKKPRKRKRALRRPAYVDDSSARDISRLLPYRA